MTKPKSKPKAAVRSTSRSTSKSNTRTRLAPSSSKTIMRPDTKHARIIAMLRAPAGTTIFEAAKDEAAKLPHGKLKNQLLQKARQLQTASQINLWLSSPGLQPPT